MRGDGFFARSDGLDSRSHLSRRKRRLEKESGTTPRPVTPVTQKSGPIPLSESVEVLSHVAGNGSPLQAGLKAEMRRLLSELLLADLRANPPDFHDDFDATVESCSGLNRNPGEAP